MPKTHPSNLHETTNPLVPLLPFWANVNLTGILQSTTEKVLIHRVEKLC